MIKILIALLALAAGGAGGYFVGRKGASVDESKLLKEATDKAEAKARELTEAQEKELQLERKKAEADADARLQKAEEQAASMQREAREELEKEKKEKRREWERTENRLEEREKKLDARAASLDTKQAEAANELKSIARQQQSLEDRTRNLTQREGELQSKLEEIAGLSAEEAREQVVASVLDDAKLSAARQARQIEESALEEADKRAKKVLATTIQRYAGEYVTERCVSVVNLPSDDMKGRIIGREGRNIRALETATGCDFVIDDTPEAIIISGFDAVRREVARLSLERLMADGRIHPARIEEVVERTTREIDKVTKEAGEQAAFELGLTDLHPEILRYMGRLKYRTSYGQNMWAHSIEAGFLCGLMAGELGLNVKLARRAGFLHDIGKAMDQSEEGGHAIVGANFIKKYGESPIVVNAVAAHHDEVKPASVIAHLVIAADALSGARPGARREVLESYVKRLEDLERIATSFKGVQKCYAIQAGREIRVMVANEKVNDDQASVLSRDIARRIEDELTYPGQIRVTVIRETRATEIAR